MKEEANVRYATVSPPDMEKISRAPGFLRFQFQATTGKWQNHFPLKNPHTKRGLQGEYPPVRAVFKI